ncbi:hypothetical protein VTN00DRAFT_1769 [Thermoascus crustaceus]
MSGAHLQTPYTEWVMVGFSAMMGPLSPEAV